MADEYQDANEAWNLLLRTISQDEADLLMVGDVEQGTYSFRQVMSRIFPQRCADFAEHGHE